MSVREQNEPGIFHPKTNASWRNQRLLHFILETRRYSSPYRALPGCAREVAEVLAEGDEAQAGRIRERL